MMDFNDPNEPWRQTGFDPYKGMSLKERQQAGCIHGVLFVVAVVVLIIIAALCNGCTTTKEVIVEKVRTDTVYVEKTTEKTKTLKWLERWRVRIGTIFFIVLGLFAIYCGWSFWKNVRNKLP